MATREELESLKERYSLRLFDVEGVTAVGVEQDEAGQYRLTIHVDVNCPDAPARLPQEIEGVRPRIVASEPYERFPRREPLA